MNIKASKRRRTLWALGLILFGLLTVTATALIIIGSASKNESILQTGVILSTPVVICALIPIIATAILLAIWGTRSIHRKLKPH